MAVELNNIPRPKTAEQVKPHDQGAASRLLRTFTPGYILDNLVFAARFSSAPVVAYTSEIISHGPVGLITGPVEAAKTVFQITNDEIEIRTGKVTPGDVAERYAGEDAERHTTPRHSSEITNTSEKFGKNTPETLYTSGDSAKQSRSGKSPELEIIVSQGSNDFIGVATQEELVTGLERFQK